MKSLTIFTATYNRESLLPRLYDSLKRQTLMDFEWLVIDDGSTDNTADVVSRWVDEGGIPIRYIHKENGGLYTGYNTAIENISTELCMCIDSDDFLPDNAVEIILNCWNQHSNMHSKVCGIMGLDYNVVDGKPIGGFFENTKIQFWEDVQHRGDVKPVFRTELLKSVAPLVGFPGEKDFNPSCLTMQVHDMLPVILVNENLCWVEYQQGDASMSAGILKQYIRSPRSFAKMRLLTLNLKHGLTLKKIIMQHIHYVSSCILSKDNHWLKNSPNKFLTLVVSPFGVLLTWYIIYKTRK